MRIARILAPVDFGPVSPEAMRYAGAWARHYHAELLGLHVAEPPQFDFSLAEPAAEVAAELATQRLRAATARLHEMTRSAGAQDARSLVVDGDPAGQIIAVSEQESANLIIMPTRGRSRVRELLIGSVTAKVLHDSSIPMLTGVHLSQSSGFPQFALRRIVCAVDFGAQTTCVMRWSVELAREFGASLCVAHAAPGPVDGDSRYVRAARETLSELIDSASVNAEAVLLFGEPHKAVTVLAEQRRADLLVIGRGVSDTLMGRLKAQAYAIVRQSSCPVLSV